MRQGMPLPQSIQNAPELYIGLNIYYLAFLDLNSCRGIGSGVEGLIPWTATRQWADENELSGDQRADLFFHIPTMDDIYLKFRTKKMAGPKTPAKPKPKGR